ncbi:spermidine synthase, partial [Pseudoalteromonas undina]
ESAIYAMIGSLIVAMGLGAFLARWFNDGFTAFAWLESIIGLIGMGCILAIAGVIAVSYSLTHFFSSIFNLPPDIVLYGYVFKKLQEW